MPSLNNNLSELDTLLQDLSNARYSSQTHDRGMFMIFQYNYSPIYTTLSDDCICVDSDEPVLPYF